jgi:CotH kinase protein/Chitobiase/beta-hexosaminidase C-terminal domain
LQPGIPSRDKLCALPRISRHLVGLLAVLLALTAGLFLAVAPRTEKVKDTKFALGRGLYDGPVTETITTATPGATIVYTTDGTEPSLSNGTAVSPADAGAAAVATVGITRATALRAAAFKAGYDPTNVDTHTYIMLPGVLAQDGTGLPPHAVWGHNGPDWAMDPGVVGSPRFGPTIAADLRSLPSLALTMDWDDLFGGDNRGIYIDGEDVGKAAVAELIVPPGVGGEPFHTLATAEVVGGSSVLRWRTDKLSLRLEFPRDLRADVFATPGAARRFDTLVLDAGFNNHWHYGGLTAAIHPLDQRRRAQFVLDQYVADLQRASGGHAPHGRPIFLYLNGLFWGVYMLHERPDADFAAAYLGGAKNDYDVVKHQQPARGSGRIGNYRALVAAAKRDLSVRANYRAVAAMLDIDDFIRYLAVNFFVGNSDWSAQNWYATFNHDSGTGRWRFHSWDAEYVLDRPDRNVIEVSGDDTSGPKYLHSKLRHNPEYRGRFSRIVRALMAERGGPLTPEGASALYIARLDEIERAVVPESARWGDNRRPGAPYTHDDWLARKHFLLNTYFPARTRIVLRQLRDAGLYTGPPARSTAAPPSAWPHALRARPGLPAGLVGF